MKLKQIGVVLCLLFGMNQSIHATNPQLNETVVRMINQLNALLPLLDEAQEEMEPNARIVLHTERFIGTDGKEHPGLREDILSMRQSLIDFINQPAIAPKVIKPLALDYTGATHG